MRKKGTDLMALETIDRAEFDLHLATANERLRQELADAQERVRKLDSLLRQKEAILKTPLFSAKYNQDHAAK